MITVMIVGIACQAVGLILALLGFRKTWLEHGAGQDFWAPEKRRVRRIADCLEAVARRLIGRPKPASVHLEPARISVSPGTLEVTVTWGRLPSPVDDLEGFATKVQEHFDLLHKMAQDNQRAIDDEKWARIATEVRVDTAMKREATKVEKIARWVAVGGLRLELLGWALLFVGLILSGVGSVGLAVADG